MTAFSTSIELPLYDTFINLLRLERDQPNKSVDTNSYFELIRILQEGYMINSLEELVFFCKKLWLKPFHINNPVINEQVLGEILLQNLKSYSLSISAIQAPVPEHKTADTTGGDKIADHENSDKAVDTPPAIDIPNSNRLPEPAIGKNDTIPLFLSIAEADATNAVENSDSSNLFNNKPFQLDFEYLPVSRRFIEQTVRSLRYKLKGAGRPVIDIASTVKDKITRGYVSRLTMREEDAFVTRWTLLFDRGGSMIAFHSLQDAIAEAAFSGTMKNEGDVFYFKNAGRDYLYRNPLRTNAVPLKEIAMGPRRNILIISDAGAARGTLNDLRIDETYLMLYYLRRHRIAWLNPLPRERWLNTSAAVISNYVSMFEPGENEYADNLGNIVNFFKSKLITNSAL